MIPKYLLTIAVILAAIVFFLFSSSVAWAQSVGIRISPVRIEDIVDNEQVISETLKVTNQSNSPRTLYAYIRDFRAEGESGSPRLLAPGSEPGPYLASWIDITSEGVEFEPSEEKTIPFTIRVPSNVGPGGYYGAILFGTKPPRLFLEGADKGAGMAIAQQTGTLILMRVKGETDEEAKIREFTTSRGIYGTPYDVEFVIRIENNGNVHVKPVGAITLFNMFGKEVGRVSVNESGANVLPDSIRRFTENWAGVNGFGRYTARLGLSYGASTEQGGQGKQSLFTEAYFWIIPWKILIPMLVALIILFALLIILLKLYKNKAVRRAMKQAGLGRIRYVKSAKGRSAALHFSIIMLVTFIVLFVILSLVYFLFFA